MTPGRTSRWLVVAVYAGMIFWLSHQTDLSVPAPVVLNDKICHGVEYAGFTTTLAMALAAGGSPLVLTRAASLAILCGLSDEYHQRFVPGRDSDLADVAADAVGTGSACLALAVYRRRRRV
ncbi:MAG TPA: VanZ family protein [bacterium]|jgi:VanZ family protein